MRINPKFNYDYSSFRFKREGYSSVVAESFGYLRPSALLGYEMMPNFSSNGVPVESNSFGLIGKEYKLEKESSTFRVLLLGPSIAWCDWSRQFLEKSLNDNPSLHSRYQFEIWNAGCPGYDVRRYYLYLKNKGLSYKPDMVMLFVFMNDFSANINIYYKDGKGATEYCFPLRELSKVYSASPYLMKNSYLYRYVILNLNSYLENKHKTENVSRREYDGGYYARLIKDICDTNKIPLLAIIFPYLKPLNEYTNDEMQEYTVINKVIKDSGINSVNLYDKFPEAELYGLRSRKQDQIHPARQGHRLIADIIYNYMMKNYFSDRGVK